MGYHRRMKRAIVINLIPTYNEKDNITKMLINLVRIASKDKKHRHLILVVDDNSPDGTGKIVKRLQKMHKIIHLMTGEKKGLGAAMIRGLKHSLHKLKADIIIPNEADFAFDPAYIPYMISKIDSGYDVVIASRHVGDGKTEGWTINRRLNHWVANKFFATWVAGVREVQDHNGAFRAIRVKGILDRIDLDSIHITGFGFFSYILFRLTILTNKIHEFPVTYKFRTAGESKVSFNPKYIKTYSRDVIEYINLSIKIRLEKLTR